LQRLGEESFELVVVDEDEEREREPPVTLHMRALPLIDMIETAIARGSDLMWERG